MRYHLLVNSSQLMHPSWKYLLFISLSLMRLMSPRYRHMRSWTMVVYIYISPKDNYERVRIYAANIHITNAILKSLFHADLTKKKVKIETRIQSVIGEKMSDGSHTKKLNKIKLIFMGLSKEKIYLKRIQKQIWI